MPFSCICFSTSQIIMRRTSSGLEVDSSFVEFGQSSVFKLFSASITLKIPFNAMHFAYMNFQSPLGFKTHSTVNATSTVLKVRVLESRKLVVNECDHRA